MKKFCAIFVVAVLFSCVFINANANPDSNILYRVGAIIHRNNIKESETTNMQHSPASEKIIYKGKNITITQQELENTMDTFAAIGNNDSEQAALDYLIERKAVYAKAMEAKISFSEEEFDKYWNEIKDSVKTAENYSDIQKLYEAFGGEDQYWSEMMDEYKMSYTIKKYWDQIRSAYFEDLGMEDTTYKTEEQWQNKRQQLTEDIVKKEAVKKVD